MFPQSGPVDVKGFDIIGNLLFGILLIIAWFFVNEAWKKFAEQNGVDNSTVSKGSNYFDVCRQAIEGAGDQDAVNALNGIEKVLKRELPEFEYEYPCHSPDEQRWFLMRVTPMQFLGRKTVVSHINITDKILAQMDLLERERELSALYLIGRSVGVSLSLDEVVKLALAQVVSIIDPDLAMIFIKDGDRLDLKGVAPDNQAGGYEINHTHRVGQCLCGLSVSNAASVFSKDIHSDQRCTWRECKDAGFTTFAAIPLICREEVIGTLGIASVKKKDYEERRRFLEAIADDVAMCLDNSLLYEKVKIYARDLESQLAERERMEKILVQTQKMEAIGTLAGGIAHDFNNLLSVIIGSAELASVDAARGTMLAENLDEILIAGKRARDLVAQILTFARRSDEKRVPVRVDKIAKEALQFIRSAIPANVEIKQNLGSSSPILGSQSLLNQVFMNLCTNAAQAMQADGGILEVSSAEVDIPASDHRIHADLPPGPYMQVTVSDTGTGILPEHMDSIFEPYFTTKEVGEGTGMGLSLVHGIVDGLGGIVTVESEVGEGTRFVIYLPLTYEQEKRAPIDSEELSPGTEKILFIDDEASIARMNQRLLEQLGYRVTVQTSSAEALALFRSRPHDFDLVITDMTMPEMTGDILAEKLMHIRPDLPVILCTGYSKKISAESAAQSGIKAFAYKPIEKAELARTVRAVLDQPESSS